MSGLASDNGFEAEDAAREARLAQNALNSQFDRTMSELDTLLCMLWNQGKYRGVRNGADFVRNGLYDMDSVIREYAEDGVLPAKDYRP